MEELQIPDEYKAGFKLLLRIDSKTVETFINALKQAHPSQINGLVSIVASQLNTLTVEEIKDIIETLISIYNLRDHLKTQYGVSTNEVIEQISEAVQKNEHLGITDEQKQEFEKRLVTFLELDDILSFASKAIEVIRDHERLFINSCVYTDMRPVFESDSQDIAGVAIVQMLKIEYGDLDGKHEFFVALDTKDLEQLRQELDRANIKAKALESMLNKVNIPYLNYLDVE